MKSTKSDSDYCADISLCEFNLSLKCKLHIFICDRLCLKST